VATSFTLLSLLVHELSVVEGLCELTHNHSSVSNRRGVVVPIRQILSIALVVFGCIPFAVSKDVALVANKGNSVKSVLMPDLLKICKAQTTHWPDGKPVTVVIRDPASPEMKVVVEKLYGMAPNAVEALVSAANHGRANRPAIIVVNSDEALVKRVESTPGAVGLVDVYAITSGIEVLKIGGKLPLEPGYPLHGN